MCPKSQGAPVSPILYFEIIPFIYVYICTSAVSIHAERCVSQITWQSEYDPAYTRQWINVGLTLVQRRPASTGADDAG